jgi:hypothetical protein
LRLADEASELGLAEAGSFTESNESSEPELPATGPNQVWTWDIPKLRRAVCNRHRDMRRNFPKSRGRSCAKVLEVGGGTIWDYLAGRPIGPLDTWNN